MADGRNVYAAILAGGSGTRMGNPEKPKQFLMLGDKPILAHTVEKFCAVGLFDSIVILCPEPWMQQTRDLLRRYCVPIAVTRLPWRQAEQRVTIPFETPLATFAKNQMSMKTAFW